MAKAASKKKTEPLIKKKQPGIESKMHPKPDFDNEHQIGTGRFQNKIVLITGGDSGIGRAVSIAFAKEGADIAIIYFDEHKDAEITKNFIEQSGSKCLLISGNLAKEKFCRNAVDRVAKKFGRIDILINNAGIQITRDKFEDIKSADLEKTFFVNIISFFWITQQALKYLPEGGSIINTSSVTAYRGSGHLIDYASTKGAIIAFTRSLAQALADKKIRVNAVAPGPVWTPLITSSFNKRKQKEFGKDTLMKRPGQPEEIAPSYLFLAGEGASYITGQVIHPNGGEIING